MFDNKSSSLYMTLLILPDPLKHVLKDKSNNLVFHYSAHCYMLKARGK